MPFDEIAEKIEEKDKEREYLRTGLKGDRTSIWPRDPSPSEIGINNYIPEPKNNKK